MDLLLVVIVIAVIATVGSLALGLLAMAGGGHTDKDFGTPLMWTRVGLQTATLLLLGVAILLR